MGTVFIALRSLVYVSAFVGFFAWLALRIRLIYEEPVLEKQFGASYVNYKGTTHRWLPKCPARSPVPQL